MDAGSPALLNVLKVLDLPEAVGLLAPRPVVVLTTPGAWATRLEAIYRAANASDHLELRD
jgi:hypothetical protein